MTETNLKTEQTEIGEQVLILDIAPVSIKDRLQFLANAPLMPRKAQKPLDIGLFDECARRQLSLI